MKVDARSYLVTPTAKLVSISRVDSIIRRTKNWILVKLVLIKYEINNIILFVLNLLRKKK